MVDNVAVTEKKAKPMGYIFWEEAAPRNKYRTDSTFVIRRQETAHKLPKSTSQEAVHSRMRLTLHATRRTPHGASRLLQAMSAWSVNTRRAPSRHCRNTRVYGHTTTVMRDNEYTPPPPPRGGGGGAFAN